MKEFSVRTKEGRKYVQVAQCLSVSKIAPTLEHTLNILSEIQGYLTVL